MPVIDAEADVITDEKIDKLLLPSLQKLAKSWGIKTKGVNKPALRDAVKAGAARRALM
jgi:hypothetical protein